MQCLVIEDEVKTAAYIRKGLEETGHRVVVCADHGEGERLGSTGSWDIIILDRMLPGEVDGLDLIQSLRGGGKHTPVLILSALGSLDERVRGLRVGGDDYLTKPFAFPELLARIEALTRRYQAPGETGLLQAADLQMDLVRRKATRDGKPIQLQPREFRLLEYLVRHKDQVVTRGMLLEAVWDCHFNPGTNVVDVQISHLRTKIDKGFARPLLHTVRGVGFTLRSRG